MHFNRRLWLVSAAMGGLVMLAGCSPSAKPSAAPTTRNHGSAPIAVPTDESASLAQGFTTQLTSVAAINPAVSMEHVGNPTLNTIAESVTGKLKRVITAI